MECGLCSRLSSRSSLGLVIEELLQHLELRLLEALALECVRNGSQVAEHVEALRCPANIEGLTY